eukprot:gnl/MRDRNA2_/MRDRNA2_61903_c0_seq1.p1 gnl/MRDRNA2_/MRDRNA2_61903_c0~~gnl/MRDRNA2_/MRDRNA2_61903_c0_seq1.p1  ORF type:complete len:485 (+),score=90.48 gnl/MRDRNA2_/MRDRNA2_61903_c0_seq1:73-1527(+)
MYHNLSWDGGSYGTTRYCFRVGLALVIASCLTLLAISAIPIPSVTLRNGTPSEAMKLAGSLSSSHFARIARRAVVRPLRGHMDFDATVVAKGAAQGAVPKQVPKAPRPYTVLGKTYSPLPILFDASNDLHRDAAKHPEQPARIDACLNGLFSLQTPRIQVVDISRRSPNKFSQEQLSHARDMLVKAHTEEYVSKWEARCRDAKESVFKEGRSPDCMLGYVAKATYLTPETFDLCLRTAAAWIQAVDVAMEKKSSATMALTRPPGHHATQTKPSGFCIFNFAAAAAIHALERYPERKVSMLDWDVHYGQGVADIMQRYDRARYVSIHQIGIYPFNEKPPLDKGQYLEVFGEHQNIMTVPIDASMTWSTGYEEVFKGQALPFIRKDGEWVPDLVIVCCGFDALDGEALADVSLQATDYKHMTHLLREHISENMEQPPGLMFGLEGGYNLQPDCEGGNVPDALLETVKALVDDGQGDDEALVEAGSN